MTKDELILKYKENFYQQTKSCFFWRDEVKINSIYFSVKINL